MVQFRPCRGRHLVPVWKDPAVEPGVPPGGSSFKLYHYQKDRRTTSMARLRKASQPANPATGSVHARTQPIQCDRAFHSNGSSTHARLCKRRFPNCPVPARENTAPSRRRPRGKWCQSGRTLRKQSLNFASHNSHASHSPFLLTPGLFSPVQPAINLFLGCS